MLINWEALKNAVEVFARPKWGADPAQTELRTGGGETYVQMGIREAASHLTPDAIRRDPCAEIAKALSSECAVNLLDEASERCYALDLLRTYTPQEEMAAAFLEFLHGQGDLYGRLQYFLAWAKVMKPRGLNKQVGVNATVASYLLSAVWPRDVAFCKPRTYTAAAINLLGYRPSCRNKAQRILDCSSLYRRVLSFLEAECALSQGNLFDVHSLFFLLLKAGPAHGVWNRTL